MRRTLVLDEDDLIMVVKEDIVKQVDENRGEMNRTEFVNHLIQSQLREYYKQQSYVTKEEFQKFTQEIMELLHNFLQFFVCYGMALGRRPQNEDFQALNQQLESLNGPLEPLDESEEDTEEP
jgi:CRISPR/Cas system CSM-associated protein Csm2 small subunit